MTNQPLDEEAIFLAALEKQSQEELNAFVEEACADRPDLLERVRERLGSHDESLGPLDAPITSIAATIDEPITEKPGTQIGPYKLLQQIGEGGMGVVYLAEQKEPVKRRVALKIIKPGMDTRQVIARFEAERQAVAMMDHPNIAKVLDAGATGSGRPFFAMELVNGLPLTKFCDEQQLTPQERLELFVPVCEAVQHAHQKGIIHRDLKPSNILVAMYDGKPVPKVIDFGVAKAVNQQLTEKTMFTQLGQLIGTLEYMSPEQAERNQLDIDTRSDIYSLGVVLYELLAGEMPFDRRRLRSAAFDEMLRIIREEEPPRPSTKLSTSESLPAIAARRRVEPARMTRALRGELDWIVMKALSKERARRYESASSFADDIQRFLENEQVIARPPTWPYRFRKFAAKHRVGLAVVGAVFVAMLCGLVGVTTQLVRVRRAQQAALAERQTAMAERNRAIEAEQLATANLQQARNAINEIMKVSGAIANTPGTQLIRRDLLNSAVSYYAEFVLLNRDVPDLQTDVAIASFRMGDLKLELGEFNAAIEQFQHGIAIIEQLLADRAEADGSDRSRLFEIEVELYFALGSACRASNDLEGAESAFRRSIAIGQSVVEPSDPESQKLALARNLHNLAIVLLDGGDQAEARREAGESLALTRQLTNLEPANSDYQARLARISGFVGMICVKMNQWDEAQPYHELALRIHERLARESPKQRDLQRRLAVSEDWMARVFLHRNQLESALEHAQNALRIGETLVEAYPLSARFRNECADHYLTLGRIQEALENLSEAAAAYEEAIDKCDVVAGRSAAYPGLVHALGIMGEFQLRREEFGAAEQTFGRLLQIGVEASLEPTQFVRTEVALATALAGSAAKDGASSEAPAVRDRAIALLESALRRLKTVQPADKDIDHLRTRCLELLVELNEASGHVDKAKHWRDQLQAGDSPSREPVD